MSNQRKLILSIEDDQDIANLIRLVLRHAPVDVMHASSGAEAWPILERRVPDLILLDMMLPGISGLDFLAKMRENPRYTSIPVIIVSIQADTAYRTRAESLGVIRYLLKPFSPAALRQEIQNVFGIEWKVTGKLSGLPPANV